MRHLALLTLKVTQRTCSGWALPLMTALPAQFDPEKPLGSVWHREACWPEGEPEKGLRRWKVEMGRPHEALALFPAFSRQKPTPDRNIRDEFPHDDRVPRVNRTERCEMFRVAKVWKISDSFLETLTFHGKSSSGIWKNLPNFNTKCYLIIGNTFWGEIT